jgi:hypothetical protein
MIEDSGNLKSCKIIYGYKPGCLDEDSFIILIEPRTDRIDEIQCLKRKDFVLIKKVLVKTNILTETILYCDRDRDSYFMKRDDLVINGTNLFNVKKYQVYTTSIENIIKRYTIQNINSFVININIENCNEIVQSMESYNHIISRICINKQIANYGCKILDNFYCLPQDESNELDERSSLYIVFVHKNLNVEIPKIVVYFYETNKRSKEMTLFLQQYKISLLIHQTQDQKQEETQDTTSTIVPYPESIKYIDNIQMCNVSKIYYENVINNLECIFDKSNSYELDIIIQFNSKYFDSKNTLQIMYPLQDNVLYINKFFDIIYGTKNCMFMLYQILKSTYFTDYIQEKILEKRSLFKIFSKRYFYDYISKIFVLKEIQ